MKRLLSLIVLIQLILPTIVNAQNVVISGHVKSASDGESLSSVSVVIKNSNQGTYTDPKGKFKLNLSASSKFPITLIFSSTGFEFKEVLVSAAGELAVVSLNSKSTLGEEVVISATKTPTRILESPVSIERINSSAIKNSSTVDYFDMVNSLKGIDLTTSSLTFKTVTSRGFGGSGNTRFTQLVDGMDNQAPGLNFSIGSIIGLSELDVDNMELLQGASSALYGPGGMNGTLLINSKDPFKYQGLSFQTRAGVMNVDGKYRDRSSYNNWDIRYAKKVSERFAFKFTAGMVQGKDWYANDQRNVNRSGANLGKIINGTRDTDPNYDGMNVYGDETSIDINQVLNGIGQQAPFLAPYIAGLTSSPNLVSRTGYTEKEVIDPITKNLKFGFSLNYKLTHSVEAILSGHNGSGNTVYTGSDRYSLVGFRMGQYKLELKHKNWMLRGYTSQENAGQSYNVTIASRVFNELWKPSPQWYTEYGLTYLNSLLSGKSANEAHTISRSVADIGRPEAGSAAFNTAYNSLKSVAISKGGAGLIDKTNLYVLDGQYNLSSLTGKFAEILVGGNFRRFVLNSQGTLFADSANKIPVNEYGAYIQATKAVFEDKLKFTFSGRYDKNSNFKGRFTPRATALVKLAKDNHLRFSYQQAYRFPSVQQQWINLSVGGATLIGGIPQMRNYYKFNTNQVYSLTELGQGRITPQTFNDFKPESVTSLEVGYKGLVANSKLLIDVYAYKSTYQDFITRVLVAQSTTANPSPLDILSSSTRRIVSVPTNSPTLVKSSGWGLGLEYRLGRGFYSTANVSSDLISNVPVGYITYFNSPKYRTNVTFGNNGMGKSKKIGFNIAYRWQSDFYYESDLANGNVPAFHNLDAQVSYKLPKIRSGIRIGATNLLNQYYINALANPSIGGIYYVAIGYNIY